MWALTSLAGLFADGGTILQDVETNTDGEWFCTVTQHHFLRHYYACYSQECAPCTRGRQRALPPCKRSDGPHRSFFSTRGNAPRGARMCTFVDSTSSITACAGVTLQQSPSGFSLTWAQPLSEKSFVCDFSVHLMMEATLPTNAQSLRPFCGLSGSCRSCFPSRRMTLIVLLLLPPILSLLKKGSSTHDNSEPDHACLHIRCGNSLSRNFLVALFDFDTCGVATLALCF